MLLGYDQHSTEVARRNKRPELACGQEISNRQNGCKAFSSVFSVTKLIKSSLFMSNCLNFDIQLAFQSIIVGIIIIVFIVYFKKTL